MEDMVDTTSQNVCFWLMAIFKYIYFLVYFPSLSALSYYYYKLIVKNLPLSGGVTGVTHTITPNQQQYDDHNSSQKKPQHLTPDQEKYYHQRNINQE